jgi:AbrB family looped-hinge helix DNA binding protein
MRSVHITNTNKKGQLVIPISIREKLSITPQTPLYVYTDGATIHIQPLPATFLLPSENNNAEILKKTQGSWPKLP